MANVENNTSKVELTPEMIPDAPVVSHKPLGGKVGITADANQAMFIAGGNSCDANALVTTAIEAAYGENAGDGEKLNFLRRRNLGLI